MQPNVVFFPLLAHILLVFALYIVLGVRKSRAVKNGLVDRKVASLNTQAWTDDVIKVSNCITNQFEVPMLFYALTMVVFLTNSVSPVVVSLLSLFVLSRYVHAYVHITSNYVPYRFRAFLLGVLILLLMTVWLAFTLLQSIA